MAACRVVVVPGTFGLAQIFASSWVASNKKLCKIKLASGVHFLPMLTRYKKGRVLVVLDWVSLGISCSWE